MGAQGNALQLRTLHMRQHQHAVCDDVATAILPRLWSASDERSQGALRGEGMRRQNADSRRTPRWVNTSYHIAGTRCNGCDYLEVLLRKHRFYTEEHYYCNYRGRYITPETVDCPKGDD